MADRPLVGGVCARLARLTGLPVSLVRAVFVVGSALAGVPIVLYGVLWLVWRGGATTGRRATAEIAAGTALLVLAALLLLRTWGIWLGDQLVWPVTLVAVGASLIWLQRRPVGDGSAAARERRVVELGPAARTRVGFGVLLVVGGGLAFLGLSGAVANANDALAVIFVMLAAGLVIFAPLWLRLVREREERIRSQERSEVAAHLHDSVLQTLALVQRRADDPRAVATLARRQERELRSWLNGSPNGSAQTLAGALQAAAAEVEERHGTEVEVVTVGDRELSAPVEAIAAAAREALTNAAKFASGAPISLFAEMTPEHVEVFVRDRGPGFDLGAVPADRRGVRESITARMQRHGGHAQIHTSPGAGTEVELTL